ncbi:MAG: alpha-L-fucosidase [Vicinamibacterales bacterium]
MRIDRRTFVRRTAGALAAASFSRPLGAQTTRPVPSVPQLEWQRDELAMFVHFGINTFTNREWGTGTEDPALFAPARLDARQWARAARQAGHRAMVLTAKHHDGFCLWPTRTTSHSVAKSSWRGGDGDLVREFTDACKAEGLRAGLYLSPWDRNSPVYGDSPRYNDLYAEQLTELLTGYGPLAEVWFDGANGEGPNGRRQVYDWPRVWALVRRLQPDAVMFSDAGPDVRWCGNERGTAGEPNWSTVDPAAVPFPGATGPGVIRALQHGDPDGAVWRPAEADTSIRPGWFYHPEEDGRVRSVDSLVDLYFASVGRNAKLLLNVPPAPHGLLHETDVSRLSACYDRLRALFATDVAAGARATWRRTGERTAVTEVDLGREVTTSIARLEEDITKGQTVARFTLSGSDGTSWRVLATGATIGYARLARFEPATLRQVRLTIEDAAVTPEPVGIKLF